MLLEEMAPQALKERLVLQALLVAQEPLDHKELQVPLVRRGAQDPTALLAQKGLLVLLDHRELQVRLVLLAERARQAVTVLQDHKVLRE